MTAPDFLSLHVDDDTDLTAARRNGVLIFGCGGFARDVRAAAEANGIPVVGFVVSAGTPGTCDGVPVAPLTGLPAGQPGADGSMPANMIQMFETICGADYVTRHLVVSGGKLVIEAPVGRACDASDIQALQEILNAAVGKLLAFHADKAAPEEVIASVTDAMQKLAWHRQNAADRAQPSLDLAGDCA